MFDRGKLAFCFKKVKPQLTLHVRAAGNEETKSESLMWKVKEKLRPFRVRVKD